MVENHEHHWDEYPQYFDGKIVAVFKICDICEEIIVRAHNS